MNSQTIRQKFSEFFASKGHQAIESNSLIPAGDQTLMFTNAGMVPFKNMFMGLATALHPRAFSIQRCMRAGGKHNDLDNVGYTYRHHTFFEMLGNFSFGDYSKKEAILFAWEFLTKALNLAEDKLWVTVFVDDQEAASIWLDDINLDPKQLLRCNKEANFWSMGSVGPCGPCSEIFYDHGDHLDGEPPSDGAQTGKRYVEIWNLVFMQYELQKDGSMKKLAKPCVDTGMGLERISAVMQGVYDNYQTDLFVPIIQTVLKFASIKISQASKYTHSVKVIADHLRAIVFLIHDGLLPTNEGRGYVLRRIIRRAVRHGYLMGFKQAFLYQLIPAVFPHLSQIDTSILKSQPLILQTVEREEHQFFNTLSQGLSALNSIIAKKQKSISGEIAFKLYDTYGFPLDLTQDIAKQHQMHVDVEGFNQQMAQQKKQGQSTHQFLQMDQLILTSESTFLGYEKTQCQGNILHIFVDGIEKQTLEKGASAIIVLDQTPFYPESGGQVYDTGEIVSTVGKFEVNGVYKHSCGAILHVGSVSQGVIASQDSVQANIDCSRRQSIARNHTATHLLHAALRQTLGEHVKQRGSYVGDQYFRFDFSYHQKLDPCVLINIEKWVNDKIYQTLLVQTQLMSFDQAKALGALAFFDEKYDQKVRVLSIGKNISVELCGGTHVRSSIEIGVFKIISDTALSSGVRRIEAKTANFALDYLNEYIQQINTAVEKLGSNRKNWLISLDKLINNQQQLNQSLKRLNDQQLLYLSKSLVHQIIPIKKSGHTFEGIVEYVDQMEMTDLKQLSDFLLDQKNRVVVLASFKGNKGCVFVRLPQLLSRHINAKDLLSPSIKQGYIKGGGKALLAQAGADSKAALYKCLAFIRKQLEA